MLKSTKYKFTARATLGVNNVTRNLWPEFTSFKIEEKSEDYRKIKKANGELVFVNNQVEGINDFDFIKQCEINSISTKISIDVYVDNTLEYQGYFYPFQCEFDNDKCTVKTTLITDDYYNCIEKYWDTRENILKEVDWWVGDYRINPSLTFFTIECENTLLMPTTNANPTGCPVYQIYLPDNIPVGENLAQNNGAQSSYIAAANNCMLTQNHLLMTIYGYPVFNAFRILKCEYEFQSWYPTISLSGIWYAYVKVKTTWFAQSVITQNDPITHAQVMPAGAQWIDYDQYYQNNVLVTRWVRIPYYNNQTYKYFQIISNCNSQTWQLIDPYINDPNNTYRIWRGRNLKNVIEMFLNKSGCNLTYESDFFNNTINPLTLDNNKLQFLQVNNCSDIKTPSSSEPATILELSFKSLLDNLQNIFNVRWFIDGTVFRIEHLHYFENGFTYGTNQLNVNDLRNVINSQTNKKEITLSNKYNYNSRNIFNKERWTENQYFNYDFSDLIVKYDLQSDNNELAYNIEFITDIAAIYSNPDSFSNDSVVLIAIQNQVIDPSTNQTAFVIINEIGLRSDDLVLNGHLCLSNLVNTYWYYGRVLLNADLFNESVIFLSEINRKIQNLKIKDCNNDYNVNELAVTDLGQGRIVGTSWDIITKVKDLEIEL